MFKRKPFPKSLTKLPTSISKKSKKLIEANNRGNQVISKCRGSRLTLEKEKRIQLEFRGANETN